VIFRQGDSVKALYLIDAGIVKLSRGANDRDVLVAVRTAGWLLGTAPAILNRPHLATAETLGTCEFRQVLLADFRAAYEARLDAAKWILKMQAREAAEEIETVTVLVGMDPMHRLEYVITQLASATGVPRRDGSLRVPVSLTHQELAQAIGTSREYVTRALGHLSSQGKILRKDGWLLIPLRSPLLPIRHDFNRI
jgi:CRP/FNR family cyclic AMP-dependent transcriptional regulator